MRSIAMLNQKGGVGKTTTAVNVAAGMARAGRRVLLIDLDPQSHATMHVGVDPAEAAPGIYDLLVNGARVDDAVRPAGENLSIIPASIDLVGAELELSERKERELVLRRALEPLNDRFDVVMIDCPPSLGSLTINALAAVEEVIIPLQPHFLALQGLGRLLETVTLVRGVLNADLRISGVVLCMHEKGTRLAQEVVNDVQTFLAGAGEDDAWCGARVFDSSIRRNVKLAECPSFGQTIFDYAAGSHGAEDYAALAEEIIAMTDSKPANAAGSATPAETTTAESPHSNNEGAAAIDHPVVSAATRDAEKVPTAPPVAEPARDRDANAEPVADAAGGQVPERNAEQPAGASAASAAS